MNVLKGILGEEETKEIIKRLNKEKKEENNMFMLEETLRNEMMENRKLGREEGTRNGIKRGKEEAKLQMIKRMKKLGFALNQISQITGIREEEIEKILCKNIADED